MWKYIVTLLIFFGSLYLANYIYNHIDPWIGLLWAIGTIWGVGYFIYKQSNTNQNEEV